MDDKEILYNMFRREVSNYLSRFCPSFAPFSGFLANKIINYVDPYVSMFMDSEHKAGQVSNHLQADELSVFSTEVLTEKISQFRTKYEAERAATAGENNHDDDNNNHE